MKKLLFILLATLLISFIGLLTACSGNGNTAAGITKKVPSGFVYTHEGKFMLDGKEFRFAGANTYYMATKPDKIDATFDDYNSMKLKVMRMWAFYDGPSDPNNPKDVSLQPEPGKYDERGFVNLDKAVASAREKRIKLVLSLVNYWEAYGGMPQYVKWAGLKDVDDFYTNEQCRKWYKDYLHYIVNRKNTITGVKYKDSPEIFAWNLANEAECNSDKSGDTLYNWVKEMSAYLKSIDPNHMISLGDEGFFKRDGADSLAYDGSKGVDNDRILSLSAIDYGTFHLYPTLWGFAGQYLEWGDKWIKDHIAAAHGKGKPSVLEEFGLTPKETQKRPEDYKHWLDTNLEYGGNGDMVWMVSCHAYEDGAGHDIYTDSLEASVLRTHAGMMDNPPSPVISRGAPAFSSGGTSPASNANDNDYGTYWQGTAPGWLAYDLSRVPLEQRSKIIAVYYNNTSDYDHSVTGVQVHDTRSGSCNPGEYMVEANAAPGGGNPPADSWVTLASVKDNKYHSRQQVLDFSGYNWIRLNIAKVDGTEGSGDVKVNFDIHGASLGVSDDWIFYGDSVTAGGMAVDSDTDVGGYGTFAQMVNASKPDYFPVVENGGIGGLLSQDGAAGIEKWLSIFPGKYAGISYGINDAWCSVSPDKYYNNMKKMVEAVIASGKTPLIPMISWSSKVTEIQTNAPKLNKKIKELYAKYPQIIKGPDLWTYFKNNPDKLSSDGVHPNKEGYAALRQQWLSVVISEVYSKGFPSDNQAPSVPSELTAAAATSGQANLSWSASTDNDRVAGYLVCRDGKQIAVTSNTSYADSGASAGKTYSYSVAAYDAASNISKQCTGVAVTMPVPSQVLVVDDFESYKSDSDLEAAWADAGGNSIKLSLDAADKTEGEKCMKYEFTAEKAQGYSGMIHSIAQNWDGFKGISLKVKPVAPADNIVVQFREASGEYWEYVAGLKGSGWSEIYIPWKSFAHPKWSSGGKAAPDLSQIDQINIYQNGDENASINIDSIKLFLDDSKILKN